MNYTATAYSNSKIADINYEWSNREIESLRNTIRSRDKRSSDATRLGFIIGGITIAIVVGVVAFVPLSTGAIIGLGILGGVALCVIVVGMV